ncbi:hypothetical protein AM493_14560 [Flavobacterium akiainvivens]|uniref:Uncharacterized protein n=1 Tax=Flavobacterium akiainvivens TaxID=1202724 RepID=A0A0M8MED9_9FLAO|nr:tetratricopeptide repeat protein [Flavobacterium akiainvivens]KOS07124.1 hypothetical protein AM493_14560 [Flavobacterium akiainvivens]SFQ75866.1 Tetratricopeptide repeat-containing protein [Flavobacterium akiainvivens]
MKKVLLLPALLCATGLFAQEERVKGIATLACQCAEEIDGTQPKDKVIEAINSCITSRTLMYDLQQVQSEADKDKKDGKDKKEYNLSFSTGPDKAVQAYLNKNCAAVQGLMAGDVIKPEAMSTDKKAMAFYDEARQYSDQKMYDMAVVAYTKAVKRDPKFITAWNYLGLNYRRMENYKEAIKCYEKSLELDPTGTFPMQNMGVAYQLMGDYAGASAAYEKLVAAQPENPEGYYGAGLNYYQAKNYEKGVDYMIKAYLLYTDAESPYADDAKSQLVSYYKDLEAQGKLDIFETAATNNGIKTE